jgi:DNA polymerase-3 subunit alpha
MAATIADLPEALASTVEIARRCSYRPQGRKPILPNFVQTRDDASPEERSAAEDAEFTRQAEEGLAKRLAAVPLAEGVTKADYTKRRAYEIDIIKGM